MYDIPFSALSYQMKKSHEIGQEQFDALLELLSPEREGSGEAFEKLREGLVRYFEIKGCHDPLQLADDTISRVAEKIDSFDPSRNTKPISFIYGFAANVLREYRRTAHREIALDDNDLGAKLDRNPDGSDNRRLLCLRECIEKLSAKDREIVGKYFGDEGISRQAKRKIMSESLGCSAAALHTRISRIRAVLRRCIENCVADEM